MFIECLRSTHDWRNVSLAEHIERTSIGKMKIAGEKEAKLGDRWMLRKRREHLIESFEHALLCELPHRETEATPA
jgi:hypothetical protein